MEARLENLWQRDAYGIWIVDHGGHRGALRVLKPETTDGENAFTEEWIEPGEGVAAQPPYTLELRTEVLEAIIAAGNEEAGLKPPTTHLVDHLLDAQATRDTLLGFLDRGLTIKPYPS